MPKEKYSDNVWIHSSITVPDDLWISLQNEADNKGITVSNCLINKVVSFKGGTAGLDFGRVKGSGRKRKNVITMAVPPQELDGSILDVLGMTQEEWSEKRSRWMEARMREEDEELKESGGRSVKSRPICCTDKDWEKIKEKSKKAGVSISAYIRGVLAYLQA